MSSRCLNYARSAGPGSSLCPADLSRAGVQNLDELEAAAKSQRIRTLPGMGAKTEQNILEGISN